MCSGTVAMTINDDDKNEKKSETFEGDYTIKNSFVQDVPSENLLVGTDGCFRCCQTTQINNLCNNKKKKSCEKRFK